MKPRTPQEADTIIGAKVRALRLEQKISQEKLGDAIGVTFQQVQKYEKGTNRIGSSRIVQISDALKVPATYFFEEMGKFSGENNNYTPEAVALISTPRGFDLMAAAAKLSKTQMNTLIDMARALNPAEF